MATVRVTHSIGELSSDFRVIVTETRPRMRTVVRDGVKVGTELAKANAKAESGPHGKNFYKRITSQMNRGLGLFGNTISGEFGPSGSPKTEFVGAGFRNSVNTDLLRAADIVGPSFLRSVDDEVGDLFNQNGF